MSAPILLLVLSVLFLIGAAACYSRVWWRHHLQQEAVERAMGNSRLRRRMAGLVVKDRSVIKFVHRAEHMRGWVWIVIAGRAPFPGERPFEAHDEQMGWALTKRGARRRLHPQRRNERGDVSSILMLVGGLMVAAFIVSQMSTDMSAGDVLDWLLVKAEAAIRALF